MRNLIIKDEIDALKTVYENFQVTYADDSIEFTVVPNIEDGLTGSSNHVSLTIRLCQLDNYPTKPPVVTFPDKTNLLVNEVSELTEIVNSIVESHEGFEVIFDMFTHVTDYLRAHNSESKSVLDRISNVNNKAISDCNSHSNNLVEEDISDAGKIADKDLVGIGDRVTEEEFLRWKKAFAEEMIAKGIWKDSNKTTDKPTGKELFLSGVVS